jgi:hypothetical protein
MVASKAPVPGCVPAVRSGSLCGYYIARNYYASIKGAVLGIWRAARLGRRWACRMAGVPVY